MTSVSPERAISRPEFIALMAMMFATIAFSVDAMLPALPQIGADLASERPQRAAFILTAFLFGMGGGTIVAGPLSDALGRKPVVYLGLAIYVIGAVASWRASSLEFMLAARMVQGIGAAGPRVVSNAIIRDLFTGREMARVMSFTMMVFLIVPALAPFMGATILEFAGWRGIFASFVIFACVLGIWFGLRVPETLPVPERRPLRIRLIFDALSEMVAHPTVRLSIAVQTLMLAVLFSILTMIQPIFDQSFGRGDTFVYWFGGIALASGVSSLLNSKLVVQFGMRRLATWALTTQVVMSTAMLLLFVYAPEYSFPVFIFWLFGVFFQAGMTVANLNALAMEPMGHIAGMAASILGALSTIIGAIIASPVATLFDGTPRPLVASVLVFVTLAALLMQLMRRAETHIVT